jgi:hypothetical protein
VSVLSTAVPVSIIEELETAQFRSQNALGRCSVSRDCGASKLLRDGIAPFGVIKV